MRTSRSRPRTLGAPLRAAVLLFALTQITPRAAADEPTVAGKIRHYATLHSIGVEWDIQGDSNHTASCQVAFRKAGQGRWHKALDLLRIDYHGYYAQTRADRAYNMLAGSIFFLKPGTRYEVRLRLQDADGGGAERQFAVDTWAPRTIVPGARSYHVSPGDGGGVGTRDDPIRGLIRADQLAQPGDRFLLHAGDYGEFFPHTSGTPGHRIVYQAAGDGIVDLHHLNIGAHHLWFEGFRMTPGVSPARNGIQDRINATDIVIRGNHIEGFHYGILVGRYRATNWVITDNVIIGDKDMATGNGYGKEHSSGEGVELNHSSHHVVCYNTISKTADGVSYPGRNCDIFGNDIFSVSDDGVEPDSGYANVRIWGNRIQGTHKSGISIQPMLCSPWYILFNQIVSDTTMIKMRVCDRLVMINNTFIVGKSGVGDAYNLLKAFSRNNIWYGLTHSDYLWIAHVIDDPAALARHRQYVNYPHDVSGFRSGWGTDLDYDAFGKKKNPPGQFAGTLFGWYDSRQKQQRAFRTVEAVRDFLDIESNAVAFSDPATVFQHWSIPDNLHRNAPGGEFVELEPQLLVLQEQGPAVDAGQLLPNIHAGRYFGRAPDLGAHELGIPLPYYGARDAAARRAHDQDWVLPNQR